MNQLYQSIGISKQAVWQYAKRQSIFDAKIVQLVTEADELQKEHPGCGVEKMHRTLNPDFIGRDRFIELMMNLGYRVKRKKNYKKTTIASKIYYPNLIKGMKLNSPSTIWQSDITYIPIADKHCYAVFIIDVYTKKIVGYSIANHMRATANIKALKMALKNHKAPAIHHSDRGSQYTYKEYIKLLEANGSKISMALTGQDNAYAERINRTIKEEYLDYWKPQTLEQLKRMTKRAVQNYNNKRIHNNIDGSSPVTFEKKFPLLASQQRKTITILTTKY